MKHQGTGGQSKDNSEWSTHPKGPPGRESCLTIGEASTMSRDTGTRWAKIHGHVSLISYGCLCQG